MKIRAGSQRFEDEYRRNEGNVEWPCGMWCM